MARPKAQLSTSVYMNFRSTRRAKQATRGHVRIRSLARSPCPLPIMCAVDGRQQSIMPHHSRRRSQQRSLEAAIKDRKARQERRLEIVVYFILRGLPREAAIQIARLAERGSPVNPIEL